MVRKNKAQDSDSEDNWTFSDDSDFQSDQNDDDNDIKERIAKLDDPLSAEESDSAPEEVTFKTEKEKFQSSQKRTAAELKKQKTDLKKLRTDIHARNAMQKKEKLQKLNEKRLPDDFFDSIVKTPVDEKKENNEEATKTNFDSDLDSDSSIEKEDAPKKEEEFISIHGSTVFKVKNITKNKQNSVSNEAIDFKEKALFRKNIRREPARCYFAKLEKQRASGKL